mgnify:CR=1 FL=1
MEMWSDFIVSVGFPVAVAAFVLVRLEPALRQIRDAMLLITAFLIKQENINEEDVMKVYKRLKSYVNGLQWL